MKLKEVKNTLPAGNYFLINGVISYAMKLDQSSPQGSMVHPQPPMIPAALAVAEWKGLAGRDFITAVLLGFDIEVRVAMAVNPSHMGERGFHTTGTWGTFGAEWRKGEFAAVRKMHLKTGRAWAIKEALRKFWKYRYAKSAAAYFRRWYFWATHSRLAPMMKAAKTLQGYLANIMTYFKHRISNATAEGLNSKIQMVMVKEMACGFRNREHYRIAIYFHCGGLELYP